MNNSRFNTYNPEELSRITDRITHADAILITASNGLSISEGLNLFASDLAFDDLFGDFKARYGIPNILTGVSATWPTEEEKWCFLSRLIDHYCNKYVETNIMRNLKAIVGDTPYFILTSNGECHFEKSGFDPDRIFEIEGKWSEMQCARACSPDLYPTFELAKTMVQEQSGMRIPTELVPHCPHCGGPMQLHLQVDRNFIHDTAGQARLAEFLSQYQDKTLVVLELGIGPTNRLIKAPIMQLVQNAPHATYITINLGELFIPASISDKSFGINGRIDEALACIREACGQQARLLADS